MFQRHFIISAYVLYSVLWWVGAWIWESPLNSDLSPVREILAVMGLCFLVCGTAVYARIQGDWSFLFALYTCSAAIHWAGPLGNNQGILDSLLLSAYVLPGVLFFATQFLHLALVYQKPQLSRRMVLVVHAPLLPGFLLCLAAMVGIVDTDALALLFIIGSIYGFIAGLVWIYRLWLSSSIEIGFSAAVYTTLALLLAWVPNMLVQYNIITLGDYGGIANLGSLIMLAALCQLATRSREISQHGQR